MMTAGDHVKLAMGRLPGLQELEAKTLYSSALRYLYSKYKWSFLVIDQLMTTEAAYNTGTVGVTNGNGIVQLTGGAWEITWTKRKIVIGGRSEVYELVPTSGVDGVLKINGQIVLWPGDTESGLSYTIYRDVYSLSTLVDWGRDYFWWDPAQQVELPMIDRYAMLGLKARNVGVVGLPEACSRSSLVQALETDIPVASIEFGPLAPDKVYSYNFVAFRKFTAPLQDAAYPLWPEEFEDLIHRAMEVEFADNPRHRIALAPTRRQQFNDRLWECFKRNDGGAEILRLKQAYRGQTVRSPFSNVRIFPAAGGGSTDWGS